jgi:hypothetical protein
MRRTYGASPDVEDEEGLMVIDYLAVAAIGILVGMGELVSRYRDAPGRALMTVPAGVYIILNGFAGVTALFLLGLFKATLTPAGASEASSRVVQILAAGFGAMAVFRSSLFVVHVGEQDVPIGPSGFLQVVLGAADRAVDRLRAKARAQAVTLAMGGVSFASAQVALPTFCLALMQNLPKDDQEALGRQVKAISESTMDPEVKALALGLSLMNVVGDGVLAAAIASLSPQIKAARVIVVNPGSTDPLTAGTRRSFRAEARDANNRIIAGKAVIWASSDNTIAAVDVLGEVSGVAAGKAIISAAADGVSGSAAVIVQ